MKRIRMMTVLALAIGIAGVASPEGVSAKDAGSVCQFYKGDPLCKTVEESYCFGGACRKTVEYWYWS